MTSPFQELDSIPFGSTVKTWAAGLSSVFRCVFFGTPLNYFGINRDVCSWNDCHADYGFEVAPLRRRGARLLGRNEGVMGFRISKEFHFSASHVLEGLYAGHPCGRLHGHNYVIELELSASSSELTSVGFVRDYGDLGKFKHWLDDEVDHRHLNEILVDRNPSAENIAVWIWDRWSEHYPELTAVRVSETPKTWAEYRP